MRNYMEEYQRWLDSPALSNAEWEELNAIRDDKKEIESRFFAPLEFGTAGLRGFFGNIVHKVMYMKDISTGEHAVDAGL